MKDLVLNIKLNVNFCLGQERNLTERTSKLLTRSLSCSGGVQMPLLWADITKHCANMLCLFVMDRCAEKESGSLSLQIKLLVY